MKKKALYFISIAFVCFRFSCSVLGQSLLVICEPDCRIYIDDEFQGFSNQEQDGILINDISLGNHIVSKRKGAEINRSVNVKISSGYNELSLIEKTLNKNNDLSSLIRTDGYYRVFYMKEYREKNRLISTPTHDIYLMLYTGDCEIVNNELNAKYTVFLKLENAKKQKVSEEDFYYAFFKGYNYEKLNAIKDQVLFPSKLSFDKSGKLKLELEVNSQSVIGYGSIQESGEKISIYIKAPTKEDEEYFNRDFIFEFIRMPLNP